jgi:hypothetical protein
MWSRAWELSVAGISSCPFSESFDDGCPQSCSGLVASV